MPTRGRKGHSITNLVVDPLLLDEDSDDSDFNPRASYASPSKRQTRPSKKDRSASKKSKPRRKRDEYEEEGDDDLSRGSWSETGSSESDEDLEMTAAGRPARRAVKNNKISYEESSDSEESELAVFTDDEDLKSKDRKAKAGKTPKKQAPKKAPASTRRTTRRQPITEDEDEVSVPATDDEEAEPHRSHKSLIVKLKLDPRKLAEYMPRKGSASAAPNTGLYQRRSSRLASLDPENIPGDLPARTRGKSREPSQSPTGRSRRSRSASRPTMGGKGPASTTQARPRRITRAVSRASSEGAVSVEDDQGTHDNMEVEHHHPALAMSRITEESTQHSSNRGDLTNGDSSTSANKDPNYQAGMTSTSTGDSLGINIPQRELSGLLVAPDLIEENEATLARRTTRSSVALKKETVETGIFEDGEEEDAQITGGVDVTMDDEDDEDDEPVVKRRTRTATKRQVTPGSEFATPKKPQSTRKSKRSSKDSDDEYEEDPDDDADDNISGSDQPEPQDYDEDSAEESRGRRTRGATSQKKRRRSQMSTDPAEGDLDLQELKLEARDLGKERKRTRRENRLMMVEEDSSQGRRPRRAAEKPIDYRVFRPEENLIIEDDGTPPPTILGKRNGKRGKNGGSGARPLFNTIGIFGGIAQGPSVLNSERTLGFNDSDSSDDDIQMMPTGGTDAIVPPVGTSGKRDSVSRAGGVGAHGAPMDMGKITAAQKRSLADADPIGIDPNVDFSKVGGLAEHINRLSEMVALPLMYPEVFQGLGVTPPRGVLFHGPPGTGKTLLARALANSCSANGKQITFYMRKGADILSKWVGEAERQVRMLFEDARKNAPSIIFFDEIDGLAPVRSSKQDQIHASIVSTLLALMDGMDGRGQVIVIGATNRPDSVDPALRRPGRFDREFYFPLPDKTSRRAIIDIHTANWTPPLSDSFKNELSSLTKGYGGADLRALCTEAALNAVQRKYPQIYRETDKKFLIDPKSIEVTARDFMLSVDKIIPSSERSSTSGAAPLPEHIAPLLSPTLDIVKEKLAQIFPQKKKQTALEEAEYEPYTDEDGGFGRERMLNDFERTRVFKPRVLIHGQQGMGQGYLGAALLHQFEGIHVQTINLPILMGDPAKNSEATLIQLFTELRRHKPSVLYIPDLENWFSAVSNDVLMTFLHLVGSIGPSERILLLGITSAELEEINATIVRDLFGYSKKSRISIQKPNESQRDEFFQRVIGFIKKSPKEFPDPTMRPKRTIEALPIAPPPPPKVPTKEELRNQKNNDKYYIHQLKVRLMPIIEMLKTKYKRFRRPFIPSERLEQLNIQQNIDDLVLTDIRPEPDVRMVKDDDGVDMILDVPRDRAFYNIDLEVVEERVFNGYYVKPSQFVQDITHIALDCQASEDRAAVKMASEMKTNVEISIFDLEKEQPHLFAEWRSVWERVQERIRLMNETKGLPAIEELDESSGPTEGPPGGESHAGPSTGAALKHYTIGGSDLPGQQIQMMQMMQMMPPLIEEREAGSSNGYIASGEMGPKDSDGDAVMSDIPVGGGDSHLRTDSDQSSTFKTAAQSQSTIPHMRQNPASMVTQISAIVNTTLNTQTQLSETAGRHSSALAVSNTQTQFEQNTLNASLTTSGEKKTSSQENSNRTNEQNSHPTNEQNSNRTSSSNRTDVPQDTPPARPYPFLGDLSGGSASMRHQQLLQHASTTTGYEHLVAFGDSQLPDTQPLPSSEGSAPSQFGTAGLLNFSTQATAGYSGSSQQSPLVPLAIRHAITAANLPGPGPSPSSSVPPPIPDRPPTPTLKLDLEELRALHRRLVSVSAGFTIEQMEQVNAAVMDLVWQHRANWNRNEILREAADVVDEVLDDVAEMERLMRTKKLNWNVIRGEQDEVSYGDVLTSEVGG
ncbi:hypothetical protein DRE_02756 [Drechslerella stenobrocha 248]|uniref:AAA+ ATPase domain-containing protein n=1 Tax=Drechslerella stenobrocha 248 TaxID=1043628 RepID=W7HWF2_9PEZI|nr:hypothetical protein DRE_02756 [Drechslerella stenobrocha 248]